MITDYDSLKNAVADQFVTTEVVPYAGTAIGLVEANINRNVRVRRMIGRYTASMSGQFTGLPSDFLAAAGLQVNTNPVRKLEFVTIDRMDEMKAGYQAGGVPVWYTIIGAEFEVLPIPDTTYTAELTYYAKVPALSDDNTTNWLLTNYPDVYFYGTLAIAAPYVNDPRAPMWAGMYDAALEEMIVEDERARFPRPVMRARTVYT